MDVALILMQHFVFLLWRSRLISEHLNNFKMSADVRGRWLTPASYLGGPCFNSFHRPHTLLEHFVLIISIFRQMFVW
jgi:hypothetical protein